MVLPIVSVRTAQKCRLSTRRRTLAELLSLNCATNQYFNQAVFALATLASHTSSEHPTLSLFMLNLLMSSKELFLNFTVIAG